MERSREMLERRAYRFEGFVQGRGFRYACIVCATKAQVTGWVMNNSDGSVSAEIQGNPAQIADFLRRLEHMVRGFNVSWEIDAEKSVEVIGGERTFQVVR